MILNRTVAIVGAGLIGRAWSVAFARGGWEVRLHDAAPDAATGTIAQIPTILDELVALDLLHGQSPQTVLDRIRAADTLEDALEGVSYVQENIREDVATKKGLYVQMDGIAAPDVVLASSTSFITPSTFAEGLKGADRIVVSHPINPPYLVPAVEVVPSQWTSIAAADYAQEVMEDIGQSVIRMPREVHGFIMNRLQAVLLNEAFDLVDQGLATTEEVDIGIRDGLGLRWAFMGPFETIDLNAPGGVRDYGERYAAPFKEIVPNAVSPGWEGETLERIDAERRGILDLEAIAERQIWRDRKLMELVAHRQRTATHSKTSRKDRS